MVYRKKKKIEIKFATKQKVHISWRRVKQSRWAGKQKLTKFSTHTAKKKKQEK